MRQPTAPDDLEALCIREYPKLVGALGYWTGDTETARELAQEAVLRLCQHWTRVSKMSHPGGWLYRVAFNLARSNARRRRVEQLAVYRLSARASTVQLDDVETRVPVEQAVRDALLKLKPRQRAVIVLHYYADLPNAQIADVMATTVGTVKSDLHRARRKLRATLNGLVDLDEQD